MSVRFRVLLLLILTAIGFMLGVYLERPNEVAVTADDSEAAAPAGGQTQTSRKQTAPQRTQREHAKPVDDPEGALFGERTVTFADAEAMHRFLNSLDGTGIRVMGSIEALNTLRLFTLNPGELDGLLDGSEQLGFIFPAEIPGQGTVQPGAIGFGSQYLNWLGATGDRSTWGSDVRVAVLDTGVIPGTPFANTVYHRHLIPVTGDPSAINSHGTAVASLIAGKDGLAPNATVLSYRVANDNGHSDTFLIAEAVLAASQLGADIINISLGSSGQSRVLEEAIQVATDGGSVVVASAGNSGVDYLFYPAGYEQVVGVGAVDARGEHLDFSNTGDTSIVAPGLALTSQIGESDQISFSGTSASSPVVAGAIAATMTLQNTDARDAWQQVESYTNDAGAPGADAAYGAGILDVGRVLNSEVAGITDVALASNHLRVDANGYPVLQVTVENRGTTQVVNAPVTVNTPLGTNHLNVATLAPGEIHTFELAIGRVDGDARVESMVGQVHGGEDQNPSNNVRVDVLSQSPGQ